MLAMHDEDAEPARHYEDAKYNEHALPAGQAELPELPEHAEHDEDAELAEPAEPAELAELA